MRACVVRFHLVIDSETVLLRFYQTANINIFTCLYIVVISHNKVTGHKHKGLETAALLAIY